MGPKLPHRGARRRVEAGRAGRTVVEPARWPASASRKRRWRVAGYDVHPVWKKQAGRRWPAGGGANEASRWPAAADAPGAGACVLAESGTAVRRRSMSARLRRQVGERVPWTGSSGRTGGGGRRGPNHVWCTGTYESPANLWGGPSRVITEARWWRRLVGPWPHQGRVCGGAGAERAMWAVSAASDGGTGRGGRSRLSWAVRPSRPHA